MDREMLTRIVSSILLILCFSSLILSSGTAQYVPIVVNVVGEVDVSVYVVNLEGVSGNGVGNVSRTVDGALFACNISEFQFPITQYVWNSILVNISTTIIVAWDEYQEIVESGSNVVIVNSHGETIPVPSVYTKENWIDKIAEAIACRNVTWVHTAGYPFNFYWLQESDDEFFWGITGFQHFMSHIGLGNITCWPPDSEDTKISLNDDVLSSNWHSISNAFRAELGRPLNGSDFEDRYIWPIWGVKAGWMPGVVVEFSYIDLKSYGFYVHIGTYKTFTASGEPTDADYWRGYVGIAAAFRSVVFRLASEQIIQSVEIAINEAEAQGTSGLDEAKQLLEEAKDHYSSLAYYFAIETVFAALEKINQIPQTSFLETYGFVILVVVGIASACGLIINWKNRKTGLKKSENS